MTSPAESSNDQGISAHFVRACLDDAQELRILAVGKPLELGVWDDDEIAVYNLADLVLAQVDGDGITQEDLDEYANGWADALEDLANQVREKLRSLTDGGDSA